MIRNAKAGIALCLILVMTGSLYAGADSNSWNKIRYIGGTVQAKADPYDWNTDLTIAPAEILMVLARRQTIRIPSSRVTALNYGQEAHRRVKDMVVIGVLVSPLALFGMLLKSKDHLIGIEYTAEDGKAATVLFEAHKDNYKAVLEALKKVTGKPVRGVPE